jgi:phage/plasmid-associated DNA primase
MTKTTNKPPLKMTFKSTELIDGQTLQTIIDYIDDIIPLKCQVMTFNDGSTINNPVVLKDMLKRLRNGKLSVSYFYSHSGIGGRQFSSGGRSFQSIFNRVRNTLAVSNYKDYDVVNAHYAIAKYKVQKHKWEGTHIIEYVNERDDCINKLIELNPTMSKGDVKNVYLQVLNGGCAEYKSIKNKTKNLMGVYDEISTILSNITSNEEYLEQLALETEDEKPKKKKYNKDDEMAIVRTVWNKMLCVEENRILMCAVEFLKKKKIDISNIVLVFDGFMLTSTLDENTLKELADYIHSKTDIVVKFIEKPMTSVINMSKYPIKTIYKNKEPVILKNEALLTDYLYSTTDINLCRIFLDMFGDRYRWSGETLYKYNGLRWSEDYDILTEFMDANIIYDDLLTEYSKDKEMYKTVKKAYDNIGSVSVVKEAIEAFKCKVLCVDFNNKIDATKGLIGFNNGVLDLRGEKPVFRDGLPDDYISLNTKVDFTLSEEKTDTDAEEFIKSVLYEADYVPFITFLGKILIGGNKDQKTTFIIGDGSNGKSLVLKLLEHCLGDYAREVSKDVYTVAKKNAGGPEPHFMELRGRLLGYTVETDDDDVFLSAVFKKMSAEDTITTRGCHEKKQTVFTPLYKPLICTNNLPKFSDVDEAIERRIRIFSFPYKFVPIVLKENEKLIDKDKLDEIKKPEFINQFINLLIKYAKLEVIDSVNMITDLKTYMTDTNPIAAWFGVNYEYDKDGETITVNDLRVTFNKYLPDKDKLTDKKFGRNLKKLVDVTKSNTVMVVNHLKILKIDKDE